MQLIINAKTRSICVNRNVYHKVPITVIDLLLAFQRHKHKIKKEVFYQIIREQRKLGEWWNIKTDTEHQKKAINTRLFNAHKALYKYGIMIVSSDDYWLLKETIEDQFFNSQEETPKVYNIHGLKVWTFRNGIDFEKKGYYLGTTLTRKEVLKTEIYIDERGIRHKYFNIEKVKEIAREMELQGLTKYGNRIREIIAIVKYLSKKGYI